MVENTEQGGEKVGQNLNNREKGVLRGLSSFKEKYTLKGTGKINFKTPAMIITIKKQQKKVSITLKVYKKNSNLSNRGTK